MKKIYLLVFGVLFSVATFAQSLIQPPMTKLQPTKVQTMTFDFNAFKAKQSASRSAGSAWLNYASSIDQLNGGGPGMSGPADFNANYLFPDSLGYGEFGAGNFSSCWIHHIADVLDVKSGIFDAIDGVTFTASDAYSVDSMSVIYGYTRNHSNTSIVDTLIITLFNNSVSANMPGSGFIGATAANYATDTVSFKRLKYLQPTNVADATSKYVFKILLTASDTAEVFYREKAFALPSIYNVAAGKLMASDIMFKPGYTYALGDHIDYVANAFFFASYEEKGANTYPSYFDCNYQSASCDYNTSYILPISVRYNNAATWNANFIPSYAYTQPFGYEHHLISYKVTSPPVGIFENAANNFTVNQNQPNPFDGKTTVTYNLKTSANSVSFEVFDVRGVRVMQTNFGSQKQGNYSVEVNAEDFAPGVYFYTLTVDGANISKKMIVK